MKNLQSKLTLLVIAIIMMASTTPLLADDPDYVADMTAGVDVAIAAGLTIIGAFALVWVTKVTWRVIRSFRS